MKIALKGPSISCCSEVFRQTKSVQEQAECIVPDVYEDIGKITCSQAQLYLKSKEASDHSVNIGVAADISVFYITERRDRVRCLNFTKNFEIAFDSQTNVSEGDIRVSLRCMGVQARAINPRKVSAQLSLRAEISCLVDTCSCIPIEAEEASGDGLQLRTDVAACVITARPAEKSFVVNEQIPIDAPEEITAVSSARVKLLCGECQTIGSKALVKGEAELELACETTEGSCPVFFRESLPFSVLIDKPDENCSVGDVLLEANSLYADMNETINGSRVIEMELHAVAQVSFEKNEQLRFLSDAYSTVCPVNLEKGSSQLCLSHGKQHLTAAAEEHIQVENERGDPVCVFADILSFSVRSGKAEISVSVNLLLRDDEGIYSTQQRILTAEAVPPECGGDLIGASVASINAERSGEEIVLELSLMLDYSCTEFGEINYLTSVELDSEHPYDLAAQPSLSIVKTGNRDRWELAKLYHSSVEAIGELNAKYPLGGELLLIPRA